MNFMKIVKIDKNKIDDFLIREIVSVLENGGVVVHPSDTCYGIAVDVMNREVVKRVYDLKKRDYNKALTVILDTKEKFIRYGEWHDSISDYYKKKRMHTYVVKKTIHVPKHFAPQEDTIGIQIPKSNLSLRILNKFNKPLTATSANISGMTNVYNIKTLMFQIKKSGNGIYPDLVLDVGQLSYKKPSKIIKIEDGGHRVIRN